MFTLRQSTSSFSSLSGLSWNSRSHPADNHAGAIVNCEYPQSRQTAISGAGLSGAALLVREWFR